MPSANKGKEKFQVNEEEIKEKNTEQAQVLSTMKDREERQSNPSFDWMHEQPTKDDNSEQAQSSRQ